MLLATEQTGALEKAFSKTTPVEASEEILGISAPPSVYRFM